MCEYPGRVISLSAILGNQSQLMVSDFEQAVNFLLFCTFLKAARCFIKSEDNLEEVSPFMSDNRKCNFS